MDLSERRLQVGMRIKFYGDGPYTISEIDRLNQRIRFHELGAAWFSLTKMLLEYAFDDCDGG